MPDALAHAVSDVAETPLSASSFSRRMAAFGPFEAEPHLAVAVSGGGDSMALALLAHDWARRRGGQITALTVDHRLRPEAAAEARQVRRWMKRWGIAHRTLPWLGAKPDSGLQAAARVARYRLMSAWCRDGGVLHLLIAHHREDQAETFLMRLTRGSGPDGLSAMAAVVEVPAVRLLRPFLDIAPGRLKETLRRRRQTWIEDPSNRDSRYARTRLRGLLPQLAVAGLGSSRLNASATDHGRERQAREAATTALLALCGSLHPAGFARIERHVLAAAPEDDSRRALARFILCIGGGGYAPRLEKLRRAHAVTIDGDWRGSRTLGGCRLTATKDHLVICRESRNPPAPMAVVTGTDMMWDRRFVVAFSGDGGKISPAARLAHLAHLGQEGWRQIVAARPELRPNVLPMAVRMTLPALWDGDVVCAVPHLGYQRNAADAPRIVFSKVAFRPSSPLSPVGFFLA